MKRKGSDLVFTAGASKSNFVTDPDGILIGLLFPPNGDAANIKFQEVIGPFRNVEEVDLVLATLKDSDGTDISIPVPTGGGLVMVGLSTGAAGSPLPLRTYRITSSAPQTAKIRITPIYEM